MKVFISWSGARSRAVAEILRDWLKCVIQASQPWIFTRDIDRGALWFTEIGDQLKDASVGILCLTHENTNSPWILFEAGALAKGLSANRVCTLLIDLKPTDIEPPLSQFNHTFASETSMLSLVGTLNRALPTEMQLDQVTLGNVFATYYPQFRKRFEKALEEHSAGTPAPRRTDSQILTEILETTRGLQQRMTYMEASSLLRQSVTPSPPDGDARFFGWRDPSAPFPDCTDALTEQMRIRISGDPANVKPAAK